MWNFFNLVTVFYQNSLVTENSMTSGDCCRIKAERAGTSVGNVNQRLIVRHMLRESHIQFVKSKSSNL